MPGWHLLSVGYDQILMRSRSLVLRQAGFDVDEAFSLHGALGVVKSDSVDVLLLCHTLSRDEQRWLISRARETHRLLPIVSIKKQSHDLTDPRSVGAENDPVELVKSVKRALGEES